MKNVLRRHQKIGFSEGLIRSACFTSPGTEFEIQIPQGMRIWFRCNYLCPSTPLCDTPYGALCMIWLFDMLTEQHIECSYYGAGCVCMRAPGTKHSNESSTRRKHLWQIGSHSLQFLSFFKPVWTQKSDLFNKIWVTFICSWLDTYLIHAYATIIGTVRLKFTYFYLYTVYSDSNCWILSSTHTEMAVADNNLKHLCICFFLSFLNHEQLLEHKYRCGEDLCRFIHFMTTHAMMDFLLNAFAIVLSHLINVCPFRSGCLFLIIMADLSCLQIHMWTIKGRKSRIWARNQNGVVKLVMAMQVYSNWESLNGLWYVLACMRAKCVK